MLKMNGADEYNYNAVDLLRFLCAIFVVAIHIPPFGVNASKDITDYLNFVVQNYLARIAVPFYFVTSGFFLFKKIGKNDDLKICMQYIKRILHLYIVWTVIYCPLIILGILKDEKGIIHAVLLFVRNLFLVGSYSHLWYLPSLAFAVLLLYILLSSGIKPKVIVACSACLYIVGLLAQSWFGVIRPIENQIPKLWMVLKTIRIIIYTTRNGLFEGLLFVSVGMCFAINKYKYNKSIAIIGIIISMITMFIEVNLLDYYGFAREHDMYLFLVPAIWFLFYFIINIKLPNNPLYYYLRMISSLMFYSHLLVYAVVSRLSNLTVADKEKNFDFLLTLLFSIVISISILCLEKKKKFKFLRILFA